MGIHSVAILYTNKIKTAFSTIEHQRFVMSTAEVFSSENGSKLFVMILKLRARNDREISRTQDLAPIR